MNLRLCQVVSEREKREERVLRLLLLLEMVLSV